jgi:ABC-type amino acid transport substrate-binding protein
VRKGSPLLPSVDRAIASLRRDGTIQKIAAQHFGSALTSALVIR